MKHIVIIGNGVAGITAARHIRKKSDVRITVISGETDHFFSRTALMYIYMGHMKYEHTKPYEDWFWEKNKIELLRGWVENITFEDKKVHLKDGPTLNYDRLILATGSKSNKFNWPGQDLDGVQGLYSYQDLELMEKNTKDIKSAVVVGGGLIGIEMTEMLHSRGIKVTFLVREANFWDVILPQEEAEMVDRHILEYGIDLRLNTELKAIKSTGNGSVEEVETNKGETIPCQFVGLTVGVSPNIDFLKNSGLETDKGILVDNLLQTNIADVFAIGDCAQLRSPAPHRKAVEPIWYIARMMGETVAATICGKPTPYRPGLWFNSAKFFDIEYQTYGHVWATPQPHEDSLYWGSEDGKKCIRIVFERSTQKVLGVNALGIRMRHQIWEKWINRGSTITEVIQQLHKAGFDPEFSTPHDILIQEKFSQDFPDLKIRKRSLLDKILN